MQRKTAVYTLAASVILALGVPVAHNLAAHSRRDPVRRGGGTDHGWTGCRPAARPWRVQVGRRHAGRGPRHLGLRHSPRGRAAHAAGKPTAGGGDGGRRPVEAMAARAAWLMGELLQHDG
jgi:hypothetical protein